MNLKVKIWLIIAAFLILVGGIIFVVVMNKLNWDFTRLSNYDYVINEYEINDEYENISIITDTADIVFLPSESEESLVVCYEQENVLHSVIVKDDTLVIEVNDKRQWYEYIGIGFNTPKITIYIPEGEYGKLSIKSSTGDVEIPKEFIFESIDVLESTGDVINYASAFETIKIITSTGDIDVKNISVSTLELAVSTGSVNVNDVECDGDIKVNVSTGKTNITNANCKNFISSGSTGNISLKNVIATGKLSIMRSTGDVKFERADASLIYVKTDTGDVTGSLVTEKVFITQSDTGSIDVPKTITGDKCEITTDTGDIKVTLD